MDPLTLPAAQRCAGWPPQVWDLPATRITRLLALPRPFLLQPPHPPLARQLPPRRPLRRAPPRERWPPPPRPPRRRSPRCGGGNHGPVLQHPPLQPHSASPRLPCLLLCLTASAPPSSTDAPSTTHPPHASHPPCLPPHLPATCRQMPVSLKGKNVEEIINEWNSELEEQVAAFNTHAGGLPAAESHEVLVACCLLPVQAGAWCA